VSATFRLRVGRDLDVAVYDRPGRALDGPALERLVGDMRAVAAAGQPGKPVPLYGALTGERAELAERVVTMVRARGTGEPIAFSALRYLDVRLAGTRERVVHLGLAYVSAAHRGRGLSQLLYGLANFLLFFRSGMRRFWISNVTQVPAVFGLVGEHYDAAFPSADPRARQTFGHLLRARAIMRDHRQVFGVGEDAGFDETRQIITNAYTGGSDELKKTWDEAPKHRDPAVNAACRASLDYGRGDDFLQLGVWNLRSTLRFLRGKAPRAAAGRLIFHAALLVVAAALVPIVRWLVPAPGLRMGTGQEQRT
jgi:hypothetical protein